MSRFTYALALSLFALALPAGAQQSSRVFEFGITGGLSHHDFHYRYPGEGRWDDPLGLRLDARRRISDGSAVGVAVVADRYVYSEPMGMCISYCGPVALSDPDPNVVRFSTAWQVSRMGVGATWQRQLIGALHGNAGVLTGLSWRQTLDDAPQHGSQPEHMREWFAGGEAGVTMHWRDLAVGVGGEYGRVPRTQYALSPYYSRIVGRVAYRTTW